MADPADLLDALARATETVPLPMAILASQSHEFVAANRALEDLFPSEFAFRGRKAYDVLLPDALELVIEEYELVTSGRLEGYQAARALRLPDGRVIDGKVWVRTLKDCGHPEFTLHVFVPDGAYEGPIGSSLPSVAGADLAFVLTDHEWTVRSTSRDVVSVFGEPTETIVGTPLIDLVHSADRATLLLGVAQTLASGRSAVAHLRMRSGGEWRDATVFIATMCEHQPPKLSLAISALRNAADPPSRVAELEGLLVRIAGEVIAAGLLPRVEQEAAATFAGELVGLTPRQLEIVTRLSRGERVPGIAQAMFLSASTVRNHLATVYRRFGVHSQGELIAKIRSQSDGVDPTVINGSPSNER